MYPSAEGIGLNFRRGDQADFAMKISYTFSTLRYIYDPVTLEFVNVGVVVYSQEARQMRARCTAQYGRISKLFASFDGVRLR